MGERMFTKIQAGLEATHGTAVVATTMLLAAPIPINPDRTPQYPQDLSGTRARSTRSVVYEYLVRNSLRFDNDHPAYYQALPLLLSCGLVGGVVPVEQTPGEDDYLWDFEPDMDGLDTPESLTLETGDEVQAFEVEYVMFERFRIAGEVSQDGGSAAVNMDADFFGRQLTPTAFTPALTIPTVTPMNAKLARFYLDSAWAQVGNTEKTGILRAFDIEILTGVHPKFHGSAQKTFDTHGEGYLEVLASFTFEGNSDADAIWDAFHSDPQSYQVARLAINGPVIGAGDPHSLIVDIGGTWEQVIPLGGEDRGNNLHTAILHGVLDPATSKLLHLQVTTNVAAL